MTPTTATPSKKQVHSTHNSWTYSGSREPKHATNHRATNLLAPTTPGPTVTPGKPSMTPTTATPSKSRSTPPTTAGPTVVLGSPSMVTTSVKPILEPSSQHEWNKPASVQRRPKTPFPLLQFQLLLQGTQAFNQPQGNQL
ncbi:expressed unknown protein [Seminavis robusta]|uniref:Uncharacterized protein n=1 Tax=Seminavis robusta TaxID=568900 RepID=A0A9N8H5N0_9STRA|nr:expressed unknown protein [Seminavis robusta]|eukprot:Sro119_g057980.1 n/a (140) ;mRNA; r:31060-31479